MAQASSAASASDIKSVSSPSQSISSPTDTSSSLTKSGQDHFLSELEDQEVPHASSNPNKAHDLQATGHYRDTTQTTHLSPSRKTNRTAIDSPETIDDDDLSATEETGFNPTRDNLTDGLVGLLRPSLEALDKGVSNTREAQNELKERINSLEQQLLAIEREQNCPVHLESYINKLESSKKRILVVNTILQGAQDRLNKVHQSCLKETAKRRTLLETNPSNASSNQFANSEATTSVTKTLAFQ